METWAASAGGIGGAKARKRARHQSCYERYLMSSPFRLSRIAAPHVDSSPAIRHTEYLQHVETLSEFNEAA
jgi:hypothetical protein